MTMDASASTSESGVPNYRQGKCTIHFDPAKVCALTLGDPLWYSSSRHSLINLRPLQMSYSRTSTPFSAFLKKTPSFLHQNTIGWFQYTESFSLSRFKFKTCALRCVRAATPTACTCNGGAPKYPLLECCQIDGVTAHEDHIAAINPYNKPASEKFTFLLSMRTGGQGINLTTAGVVLLYRSSLVRLSSLRISY
jgi:hypothetical protein